MRLGPFEIQYVGWKPQSAVRRFRNIQELLWLSRADKAALRAAEAWKYEGGEWNLVRAIQAYRQMTRDKEGRLPSLLAAKERCQELLRRYAKDHYGK